MKHQEMLNLLNKLSDFRFVTRKLELAMLIYNFLGYSSNYFDTTGSFDFIQKMKQLILIMVLPMLTTLNLFPSIV